MAHIYADNSLSIGHTPLVRLNRIIAPGGAHVYGKVEGRNPAYSVKCRIGASMIEDAQQRGRLKPGMEIVEPTSGNTGIALAFVAAAKGMAVVRVKAVEAGSREVVEVYSVYAVASHQFLRDLGELHPPGWRRRRGVVGPHPLYRGRGRPPGRRAPRAAARKRRISTASARRQTAEY